MNPLGHKVSDTSSTLTTSSEVEADIQRSCWSLAFDANAETDRPNIVIMVDGVTTKYDGYYAN